MNVKDINGLDQFGVRFIGTILEHYNGEYVQPDFHPSIKGAWFQVYNPVTENVVIIDGNTTVEQLQQVIGRISK